MKENENKIYTVSLSSFKERPKIGRAVTLKRQNGKTVETKVSRIAGTRVILEPRN